MVKTTIEGKEYGGCIYQETDVFIGLWDRIKILFGKKLTISAKIYTREEVTDVYGMTSSYVPPFFPKKEKGEELMGF